MKPFRAIAAMSLNRVIGSGNSIPWHIPEDFAWFKKCTVGHIVVMGRVTFESLRIRPLPNRLNWVLSHQNLQLLHQSKRRKGKRIGGEVEAFTSLADLERSAEVRMNKKIWICGGEQIYQQLLGRCSDLYLTLVKKEVTGDRFFPKFEHLFTLNRILVDTPTYQICHYINSHPRSTLTVKH